jgi:hypothetical protein
MDPESEIVELRFSYRYMKQHGWVVQAVNGFLSAYFMEQPGFRVQRHFDELESGMHVWPAAQTSQSGHSTLSPDGDTVFSRQPCTLCHRLARPRLASVDTPSRNFSQTCSNRRTRVY